MPSIVSTQVIVGMEIHVELTTRTRMFSRSANVAHPSHYDAEPNALLDSVVLALPGALPVMNRSAVEMAMMVGLALDCRIAEESVWDRKNYFYPDLPKGYQISQYELPLCVDGFLDFTGADGETKRVRILRAHLEEDAGKLSHELPASPGSARSSGGTHSNALHSTLIDLNRAGTPLLEIVTEPDLHSAADAALFAQELRTLCRFLGVTQGDMQRGHMRFEPNVNVRIIEDDGGEYITPIAEMKNLNSFRSVRSAIEYEHQRQVQEWGSARTPHAPGRKTTRGWDDVRGVTIAQREKEEANDYRYFPDPDLVPVRISAEWQAAVAERIPELPRRRRERYVREYGLSEKEAFALSADFDLCSYYDLCVEAVHRVKGDGGQTVHAGRQCASVLLNVAAKRAHEGGVLQHELGIAPHQIAQLIDLRDRNLIGSSAADTLFDLMCESSEDAAALARAHDLLQVNDDAQLDAWIDGALQAQPQAAADFAAGKEAALGRIVGEIMKQSHGRADAATVRGRLISRLRS